MAFRQPKRPVSEHVYDTILVWQCSSCSCWSRKEFVLETQPKCPICSAEMNETMKEVRVQ